jgi:colicin import membrane protein
MARKLKVYRTSAGGFFELAVAAPSMKAAAEAWGSDPDIFSRGYAEQTDDPKVVEAAMASPGVVLRRPVGSHGEFSERAALPKVPEDHRERSEPRPDRAASKRESRSEDNEKAKQAAAREREQQKQALERQQREEAERERHRREDAERERARKQRERMIAKANAALEKARARHDDALKALTKRREELEADEAREQERWEAEQHRHRDAIRQAES